VWSATPEQVSTVGPRIYVLLQVHPDAAIHLRKSGQLVPHPIAGWAMIDTGAQATFVSIAAVEQLGIPPANRMLVSGAGSPQPTWRSRHPVGICLAPTGLGVLGCLATAVPRMNDDNVAIIGRDILANFAFTVDGRTGEMALEWDTEAFTSSTPSRP
jgi:hypothetical protein